MQVARVLVWEPDPLFVGILDIQQSDIAHSLHEFGGTSLAQCINHLVSNLPVPDPEFYLDQFMV